MVTISSLIRTGLAAALYRALMERVCSDKLWRWALCHPAPSRGDIAFTKMYRKFFIGVMNIDGGRLLARGFLVEAPTHPWTGIDVFKQQPVTDKRGRR